MAQSKLYNMVRCFVPTAGNGATVSFGSAIPSYLTPALAGVSDGDIVSYVLEGGFLNGAPTIREVGQGTISVSGGSLTRTTVYSSTSGGARIPLTGDGQMSLDAFAQDFVGLAVPNSWSALQTFSAGLTLSGGALTLPANSVALAALAAGTAAISISGNAATAPWTGISGKPTTISGYGITDAASLLIANSFAAAQTINLNAAALPAPTVTGTVLHLGYLDGTAARILVDGFGSASTIDFRRGNGTAASPTALGAGQNIGIMEAFGYDGAAWSAGTQASLGLGSFNAWTVSDHSTFASLKLTPGGSLTIAEVMRWQASGGVSIGNAAFNATDPGAGNLAVQGNSFAASRGAGVASAWPNTYLPGIAGANAVLDYDIAPAGNFFGIRATAFRSSDNNQATPQNLLNNVDLTVADHTTVAHLLWGRYTQVNVTPTGKYTILFGGEISISNQGAAATALDPFTTVQTGAIPGLRIDNGTGSASANASVALDIVNNGGKFIRGIRITQDALDISSGIADALAMGPDHSLTWYKSLGAYSWRIFNNAAAGQNQIVLGNDTLDLFVSASSVHALAVTSTNFGVGIASSFSGTMTGPDGGTWSASALNLTSNVLQLGNVNALARNSGTGALTISTNAAGLILNPTTGVMVGSVGDPGVGNLAVLGVATQGKSVQVPTTGFSITVANGIATLLLGPAGVLATGTITMPPAPIDGQTLHVASSQTITSLTVSPNAGQSVNGAPTTITNTTPFAMIYNSTSTTWYRYT